MRNTSLSANRAREKGSHPLKVNANLGTNENSWQKKTTTKMPPDLSQLRFSFNIFLRYFTTSTCNARCVIWAPLIRKPYIFFSLFALFTFNYVISFAWMQTLYNCLFICDCSSLNAPSLRLRFLLRLIQNHSRGIAGIEYIEVKAEKCRSHANN